MQEKLTDYLLIPCTACNTLHGLKQNCKGRRIMLRDKIYMVNFPVLHSFEDTITVMLSRLAYYCNINWSVVVAEQFYYITCASWPWDCNKAIIGRKPFSISQISFICLALIVYKVGDITMYLEVHCSLENVASPYH